MEVAEADVAVAGRTRMVLGSQQGGDVSLDEAGGVVARPTGLRAPSNEARSIGSNLLGCGTHDIGGLKPVVPIDIRAVQLAVSLRTAANSWG